MIKKTLPLPETIALARSRATGGDGELSADAIMARQMAQRLFAALKARVGSEILALLDHDVLTILDPAYDAADRLQRKQRIYVEPVPRSFFTDLMGEPVLYLVVYPDGTRRHVTEAELLAMAGVAVPA